MYTEQDFQRELSIPESEYRTPIRRDYGRLIHSPSFRRLQGKTQLYPGIESDFFRNRLTHSLEVAQIAKTIAIKLNHSNELKENGLKICPDICEFAGLAHDLGHPPFGHQGEEALDKCMYEYGGFEGNAQTLRILSKIEKKKEFDVSSGLDITERYGLNLTYRALSSILKYDAPIPINGNNRPEKFLRKPMKGFYESEHQLVEKIKSKVSNTSNFDFFKSVECYIMDIADDIAYSTYDLEDGMKAGFYHPTSFLTYPEKVYNHVAQKVSEAIGKPYTVDDVQFKLYEIFQYIYSVEDIDLEEGTTDDDTELYLIDKAQAASTFATINGKYNRLSIKYATNGDLRSELTSKLVNKAIEGVSIEINKENPSLSKVFLEEGIRISVEVLKNFTFASQILSPRLKIAEYRGKQIVTDIFKALDDENGWMLLPEDYQSIYHEKEDPIHKKRCICDFIAGMTDKYAIEFYGRLTSERPETIFKPF
ncbi:MAG: dgt [Sphingobacterium multivorum]|jgi:dGTPase|nr:dgt [Sphingobacterium multivorum]